MVLLAKKSENGKTPSLAISCLTTSHEILVSSQGRTEPETTLDVPRAAVKVITMMLPKIEIAMMPDITLGATSEPKASRKKSVAISSASLESEP